LKAGHEVTVYNRTASKAEPLVKQGARHASTVAKACGGDAVMTMLANDDAAGEVTFGDDGILNNLARNAIHISISTISVTLSQKLFDAHKDRGQRYLAAPVFGRPEAAAAGKLFVTVAGDEKTIDECAPLFEAIGQKTFRFGKNPADANLVKLSGNFLITAVIEALAEAMALVGKAGLDQHEYLDFLTSTLFNAPVYKTYGAIIADHKYSPAGFAAPLGLKDNRLVMAAAENLRVPMPLAGLIYNRFITLLAQGGESLDWSAIAQLVSEDAGEAKAQSKNNAAA
jgi:3-hydroxyisobutyrate dehydrogenase-like beta-hydroxyacid dehydrogenase